jgi:hypothetical protein
MNILKSICKLLFYNDFNTNITMDVQINRSGGVQVGVQLVC